MEIGSWILGDNVEADEDGGRGDGIDVRWMMEDRDVIDALSAKDSIREEAKRFTREVLVTPECEESVKI